MHNVLSQYKHELYNDAYQMFKFGVSWEPSYKVLTYMTSRIRILGILHQLSHNMSL